MTAEDDETRRVVRLVLDAGGELGQVVALAGRVAGDGRRIGFRGGQLRRLCVAADRHALRARQRAVQPLVALCQRLCVRIDALDLAERGRLGEQMLVDAQHDLAADLERRRQQEVEGAADRALGRILDRNDGEVGVVGLDLAKDVVDRELRQQARGVAEVAHRSALGEGTERPEEGDRERLFQRQADRHHLPEQPGDVVVGQRSRIGLLQAAQDLRLALGAIDEAGFAVLRLDLADALRAARALVEEMQKLVVDRVDLGAHDADCLAQFLAHQCRLAKSFMNSTSACTPESGSAL